MRAALVLTAGLLAVAAPADAATRLVGPGHAYATPCAAMAAAKPGDRIRIDAKGNGRYEIGRAHV